VAVLEADIHPIEHGEQQLPALADVALRHSSGSRCTRRPASASGTISAFVSQHLRFTSTCSHSQLTRDRIPLTDLLADQRSQVGRSICISESGLAIVNG
jgi:hypothetical protein